jgi:hypothetical protein
MVKFYVGLDLGQANDYTALMILEQVDDKAGNIYHVRRLERIRGAPYPDIAQKVKAIMVTPALAGHTDLVVDQTGVGAPVVDLLRQAGLEPVAVSIHGGAATSREGDNWKVPKRDLVGTLQVLLQSGRFLVSNKLKLGPVLQAEMLNFKVKIDPVTAHDSYSAWRDNEHDDLVLSAALAAWWAEQQPKPCGPLVFGGATKPSPRVPGGAISPTNWVRQASDDMVRAQRLSR